jgi:hypothetical protein
VSVEDNRASRSGQCAEEQKSVLAALPREPFRSDGKDIRTKSAQGAQTPPHSNAFELRARHLFDLRLRVAFKQRITHAAGFTA